MKQISDIGKIKVIISLFSLKEIILITALASIASLTNVALMYSISSVINNTPIKIPSSLLENASKLEACILFLILYVASMLLSTYFNSLYAFKCAERTSDQSLTTFTNSKFEEIEKLTKGYLANLIISEPQRLISQVILPFLNLLYLILSILLSFAFVLYFSSTFAMYLVTFCAVLFFSSLLLFGEKLRYYGQEVSDINQERHDISNGIFDSIINIKSQRIDKVTEIFIQFTRSWSVASRRVAFLLGQNKVFVEGIFLLVVVLLIYFSFSSPKYSLMDSINNFPFVILLSLRMLPGLYSSINIIGAIRANSKTIEIVHEQRTQFKNKKHSDLSDDDPCRHTENFLEVLNLRHPQIIESNDNCGISLAIQGTSGLFLIKGASGSGKSTLLKIILGLVKEKSGRVLYNQVFSSTKEFREKVAYCGQDSHMFPIALSENIDIFSDQCIDNRAKIELMSKLNLGNLVNEINEKKLNLSGGERQRFAIARVISQRDKLMYIFDEPTSSLDEENKFLVSKILYELSQERIVLVVSHDKVFDENSSETIVLG